MDAFVATTLVTDTGLSARAKRLYAFMLAKRNFRTGVFMWRKAKTCEALGISETTYARAMRELLSRGAVTEKKRYTKYGRQLVTYYRVRFAGHCYYANTDALPELSHNAFALYLEIANSCGSDSWAISRRSLAAKLHVSMRTITRLVRELKDKDLISVTPENRLHICGNRGQTFNRFALRDHRERICRRTCLLCCFCAILRAFSAELGCSSADLATPLDKNDTPLFEAPIEGSISKEEKTKVLLIAKLKERRRIWHFRVKRRCSALFGKLKSFFQGENCVKSILHQKFLGKILHKLHCV